MQKFRFTVNIVLSFRGETVLPLAVYLNHYPPEGKRMELQEMKEKTLEILQTVENIYDKDDVFAKMFSAGLPFTKIQQLYREVGAESGLLISSTKAKELVENNLAVRGITEFENYSALQELASSVLEEVKGVSKDTVLKVIRSYYKEQEVVLPRRPREYAPRGPRGGKVAEAIVNYAINTSPAEMTRAGMYEAVRPHVKAPKNAYDQVNTIFLIVFAIHNSLAYEDAVESAKKIPLLNLSELEAAESTDGGDE